MKKYLLLLISAILLAGSCEMIWPGSAEKGKLKVVFDTNSIPSTKADISTIDTNGFTLKISGSDGSIVYTGLFGDAPEIMELDAGTYTIVAVSCEFDKPAFSTPQYGDTKVVKIKSGETCTATLSCYQLNCGIKLNISSSFLTEYPDAVLFLKANSGKLMYSYSEKRIAYFPTGTVSIVMTEGTSEKTLLSRVMEAQQILTIGISTGVWNGTKTGITVQVDTSRIWLNDSYVIGGEAKGDSSDKAYSVSETRNHAGEEDVWVYGYIVGGDLSSSKCSFTAPFSSRTNMVIATKSSCTTKESCISVQLAKGAIRDALNLVDNPGNLKKQVYLKGDIVESYYGLTGIQNLSEYKFK